MAMWGGPPTSKEVHRRLRRWLIIPLVIGVWVVGIVSRVMQCPTPVRRGVSIPAPAASSAPSSTARRTPIPTASPEIVAAPPPPTPRVLPASNAFTTLDDYRQRRAAAVHSPEPMTPAPAGRTPETELGRVSMLVRDYRAAYGANPVGNNREIVRTLLGDNPRGTKFLGPATVSLNERGELLDAWGHPYFFHALSGTAMEIRSAGPDGRAYTADDLTR